MRRSQASTVSGGTPLAVVAAVMLVACLSACSLVEPKPAAGNGEMDAGGSTPGSHAEVNQTQVFPGPGAGSAADQQGLESIVEQLGAEQREYEARLQALEAIVLHGYPVATATGYPDMAPPVPSAATAGQLASLPIEPDVIILPVMSPVTPAVTRQVAASMKRSSRTASPVTAEDRPVSKARPARTQPAGNSGGWVINLGSYSRKNVADRMLAEFQRQDIEAEQVTAVVNDATMYRVRVAAFETRRAAAAHAQSLQDRLGIADVWIARR